MTELSTSFSWAGGRAMFVFAVLSVLTFFGLLYYAWYRNELIDHEFELQQPVVQTCVQHRITQKVSVTSP